ncbi:MAG: glycogen debranching enzyme N-terminal domain-containing protein, partial [Bacteroidales bacterium]|nr:glycogen debranching enzyme N-terminal domain-containing protein [Bacteroidales bacterium]
MAYLEFEKDELVNLEYSLKREVLSTNHAGGYMNTTIVCCNTRKYHGLLILPLKNFGLRKHLLLSSLDETVIQHNREFNLGIHRYGDVYEPRGHKYIRNFEIDKVVAITYRVGGVLLRKVLMLMHNKEQVLIKYTLLEAKSPTVLRLKPFLAFRDIHSLSKANSDINRQCRKIEGGCSFCLYPGFPDLNLQLSKEAEFVQVPDWYYNIEYKEERRRAYESQEDLFVPGYFEVPIKKGESIYFSASTSLENISGLSAEFSTGVRKRKSRNSFETCLKIAAKQFIVREGEDTYICSGYPWMDKSIRETLISLPGLTLHSPSGRKIFRQVISTIVTRESDSLLRDNIKTDVPLWFIRTMQQYAGVTGNQTEIWRGYGHIFKEILNSYRNGTRKNVSMHDNGLLWAEERDKATSWMDAYISGKPVTERAGYQVELNSLWYNAVCYLISLAGRAGEESLVSDWSSVKERVENSFMKAFWLDSKGYLADYVGPEGQNKLVRPNQLLTCAFEYSPLSDEFRSKVLKTVKRELLTPRGIRTLSPQSPGYKGEYDGDQYSRDSAYHQGTARVWLLSFYIEASLRLYGKSFIREAKELVCAFEEELNHHCI